MTYGSVQLLSVTYHKFLQRFFWGDVPLYFYNKKTEKYSRIPCLLYTLFP